MVEKSNQPIENLEQEKASFFPRWNTANPYIYQLVKDKRKLMRDNMTPAEQVLWEYIKGEKLGVKFRRQHVIYSYIPDFFSLSCKLIIEVDGKIHDFQKALDDDRTKFFNEKGYRLIRFSNEEVLKDIDSVIEEIKGKINNNIFSTY